MMEEQRIPVSLSLTLTHWQAFCEQIARGGVYIVVKEPLEEIQRQIQMHGQQGNGAAMPEHMPQRVTGGGHA